VIQSACLPREASAESGGPLGIGVGVEGQQAWVHAVLDGPGLRPVCLPFTRVAGVLRKGADMTATAGGPQPARTDDRSAGELVKQLSEQVSQLVRDELRLAQVEMTSKGKRAGVGIGMLGGGGVIALYGLGCLLAAAIVALAGAVAAWLAALIVGVAVLLAAAAVALIGRQQLSKAVPPVPEQAVDNVKADVAEIKERAAL
jgi:uncharacterized membrane protein YqjE